jgi:hypothetical protein
MDTESIERLEKQAEILTAAVKLLTRIVEVQNDRLKVLEGTNYWREKHD